MYELTLPLQQKHIDKGIPTDCNCCAFALMLAEYFPDSYVSVGVEFALIYTNRRLAPVIRLRTNADIICAIEAFDAHQPITPGFYTFTLF